MRTAKLDEIVRQKDPALKSAVELLATGQVSAALESLQQQGRVQGDSRPRRAHPRHRQELCRVARKHPDRLTRQCLPPRVERRRSPGIEGQWSPCTGRSHLPRPRSAPGHDRRRTLLGQPLRNRRCGPLRTRQQSHRNRGRCLRTVVAINPAANLLTVEKSIRRTCHLRSAPPDRRQRLSRDRPRVLRRRPHPVHRARQVARRRQSRPCRHRVIHPDGRISARLDNNRQIEFNASEHRHFDHGYAVTSHSSQGLTAERVLVHADTGVHPDLLNSRFGYVSISRASHEATLFTDDMAKLGPQLGADVSKTSALEISQTSSVAQGIGIEI